MNENNIWVIALGVALLFLVASCQHAHAWTQMNTSYGYEKPSVSHGKKTVKKKAKKAYRPSGGSASLKCVKPQLRALMGQITMKFGPPKIISTCRPGAVVRKTGKPSLHRYGMAVDFKHPLKGQVVEWLRKNWHGGVMTYSNSSHIHVDMGKKFYARGKA